MWDPGLAGRVALVTGANHGIGAAISRELAGHGVRVVIAYLRMSSTDLDSDHYPTAYGEARGAAADMVVADVETTPVPGRRTRSCRRRRTAVVHTAR